MDISRTMLLSAAVCLYLSAPLFTGSLSSASTIYTYTEDSGTQVFTTELDSIPEQYRSRVIPMSFDIPLETSPPSPPVSADPPAPSENARTVTASGEYRMGEYDTRTDAVRMAVEAAKKDALEQVATYLESVTEVRNMDVTKDDIRTYTAGIVTVLDQTITTRLEGDTVVIRADLTAQVDPAEVIKAIAALRENESAKSELLALRAETDQLQQQLDAANRALAEATSQEELQALRQKRQDMLNEMQANALVSQAWTSSVYLSPGISTAPWIGVQGINGLLLQAQRLHPRHRHFPHVRQMLKRQTGAPPSAASGALSPPPPGRSLLVPTPPQPPASSPPYQLHPSHFWRPSPPNIHMSPSTSQPNTFVSPQQFGRPGKQFGGGGRGNFGGGGHFRGGGGGRRGR